MIDLLVTKAKGFLTSPVETFRNAKNDDVPAVFTYFGVLLLINAVLCAIITTIGMSFMPAFVGLSFGPFLPVGIFFMMLIGGAICTLVFAAWLHLWVYILGGRNGIMQTVNAVIYGSTPRLLFGWIPFLGIIFTIWSLILGVIGIRELQDMSTGKAALAAFIAIVIPLIVIILLAAYLYVTNVAVMTVPAAPYNDAIIE